MHNKYWAMFTIDVMFLDELFYLLIGWIKAGNSVGTCEFPLWDFTVTVLVEDWEWLENHWK